MARACIKKGATGGDVDFLRLKLYNAGYLASSPYVSTASTFDSELHAAVEAFQVAQGWTTKATGMDGIVGPTTWKALGETGASCSSGGSRGTPSGGAIVPAGETALPLVQRKWFLPVIASTVGIGILALLFWPKGKK